MYIVEFHFNCSKNTDFMGFLIGEFAFFFNYILLHFNTENQDQSFNETTMLRTSD